MAKLTIAEVQQKTTKGGKPYLNVKSSTGKYYTCWQEQQYIWHLLIPNATIEPIIATNGAFSSITGIVGVEAENGVAGQNQPLNAPVGPSAWDKLWTRLDNMENKLDFLIEERKTFGALPSLDSIPVINLEDKETEEEPRF